MVLILPPNAPNGLAVLDANGNASALNIIPTGATTARTLAARGADEVNAKDFGAVLNGSTNDLAAYQAVYNATPNDGIISIPPGGALGTNITGVTTKSVLWKTMGAWDYGTSTPGTNPVLSMGDGDVLETFLSGRKRFSKTTTNNTADNYAVVEIDYKTNYSSGVSSAVSSGLVVSATQNAVAPSSGVWAINASTTVTNTAGDNIGVAAATKINVSGAGPSIALYSQVLDSYGNAGGTSACEFDIYTVTPDPIGTGGPVSGLRELVTTNVGPQGTPSAVPEVSRGIGVGSNGTANIGAAFYVHARLYYAAYDCSQATFLTTDSTGNAVKVAAYAMGAGMPIDFTRNPATSTFNQHTLSYASSALQYQVGGSSVFSITDTGSVACRAINASGQITAANSGGVVYSVSGSSAVGFDTTGGTYSNSAFRMSAGQVLAFNASATAKIGENSGGTAVVLTGNLQITGSLQVGSAYTATVVTPTGYINITDSSGTVRKIPCL